MKTLLLFFILISGSARAGELCSWGSSGGHRVETQQDFDQIWEWVGQYCRDNIYTVGNSQEIFLKIRLGIRLEGHLNTNFVYCRKKSQEPVNCESQLVWGKDETRSDYVTFRTCGDHDLFLEEGANQSKIVTVRYDSGAPGGRGGYPTVATYRLTEEKDGDYLMLDSDRSSNSSRFRPFIVGGHGLSDLNCSRLLIEND